MFTDFWWWWGCRIYHHFASSLQEAKRILHHVFVRMTCMLLFSCSDDPAQHFPFVFLRCNIVHYQYTIRMLYCGLLKCMFIHVHDWTYNILPLCINLCFLFNAAKWMRIKMRAHLPRSETKTSSFFYPPTKWMNLFLLK